MPNTALEALSLEERALCLVTLSTLECSLVRDAAFQGIDPNCHQYLALPLFELWTERLLSAGCPELVFQLSAIRVMPACALLGAVEAQVAQGRFDLALRLARAISELDKEARSSALIRIAYATASDSLYDEALSAIFDGEPITMGTGRGYDELAVGVRTISALRALPAAHPAAQKLCAHIVRLGKQGQRQIEPGAFAKALADGARRAAALAVHGGDGWLGYAAQMRAAIVLDNEATSDAARPASDAAPATVDRDDSWKRDPAFKRRANSASRLAVTAIQKRDLNALFELLTDALGLTVGSYLEMLARWQNQTDAARAALLPEILALEPTPDNTWCTKAPEEFWRALAELTDGELIRSVLRLLRERDFLTRSYPSPTSRHPSSIAVLGINLAQRLNDRSTIDAVVDTLLASTRPGAASRLFDAIATACSHRAFDLARY
ncbi:MAG: hypothetical protein ABI548_13145 [Polyangiaceae bacterium]